MREPMGARAAAGARVAIASAALLLWSCATPEDRQTPAAWVKENTLIISQLASYQAKEQQEGIQRFLRLSKEQGTEVVFYLLSDPQVADNQRVVVVLARILSMWKDPRGVSYLLESLTTSQDEGIVRIAEEGLIEYGDHAHITRSLSETLSSPQVRARRASAYVLSRMGSSEALQALGKRLRSEPVADIRALCLFGIAEASPSRERTGLLVETLADPDADLRETAWIALVESEKDVPRVFDPNAEIAARADALALLRRWAKSP